ncbi:peptidoglycan/LPS O-acetylase OafA/YrhL [Paenochrobactrum gallinarii]|uniref:Peptidoglycan/LPS O-acetylase OafA/YrhL n=1 Tax=Paenochrobactrum gallinarii TaxID=643673 RepID=A0A841LWK7_9HYPH|nr:acyltransferase [Paenochrobactrum gallinarii]MBB6262573.1 peptidoglycan/LPS O-acetylase OafA/YrhL [Paenochrobactrum gallinarii]
MQRLPDFDGLRFILCLGIATFHYSFRMSIDNEFITSVILRFSYFTDIFFIVSGLFLARRAYGTWDKRQYFAFQAKRLARIYPLHVAAFSCFALISIAYAYGFIHPNAQPDTSWRNAITQLFLLHSWGLGSTFSYNYVSWSLSALFLMYLCFPLFDVLSKRFDVGILAALIIALIGGEFLTRMLGGPSLTRAQFTNFGILRVLPSFLFGMWLVRHQNIVLPKSLTYLGLTICLIIFLFYSPADVDGHTVVLEGPARLIFLYVFTFLLYNASTQGFYTPLQWSGFANLSRYSFGIFILHPLVGLFFFNAIPPFWENSVAGSLFIIAAGVTVTVFIAAISWKIFENPINSWLVAKINKWQSNGVIPALKKQPQANKIQ